jgi:hypothetical protein
LLLYSKKVCGKTNSIFVFVLFFGKKKIVRSLFHALFDPRLYYVRRTMDIYIYIIQIICPKVLSYIMYNNKYNNNNLTTSNILQLKFKFQNKNFFFFFKFYLVSGSHPLASNNNNNNLLLFFLYSLVLVYRPIIGK